MFFLFVSIMLIGAIEAGGTKFNCAIYNDQDKRIERQARIRTTGPKETIRQVVEWFKSGENDFGRIETMGLGVFGPLDMDCTSTTFGSIKTTSKSGWSNINLVQQCSDHFKVPIGFNTDVNSAAFGEIHFGANEDVKVLLYVTMGTGIGVSVMYKGEALFGSSHLELGHMLLPGLDGSQSFGSCPYHTNCWEGFCSGKAIETRMNMDPSKIPGDNFIWKEVIEHTSVAVYNMILSLCPDRIVMGGSVTNMGLGGSMIFLKSLFNKVNLYNSKYSNRSLRSNMIQLPSLGENSGIFGSIYMGGCAHARNNADGKQYMLINQ